MVVVIVLVVVLLAAAGGVAAYLAKGRGRAGDDHGPNEILQSPPTSFPGAAPPTLAPSVTPIRPGTALRAPDTTARFELPGSTDQPDGAEPTETVDRFRAPGSRVIAAPATTGSQPAAPRYPLESTPDLVVEPVEPVKPVEPVVAEAVTEPEPVEPILAESDPVVAPEPVESVVAEAVAEPEPVEPMVAETEPDPEPEPVVAEAQPVVEPDGTAEPAVASEPEPEIDERPVHSLTLVQYADQIIDLDRDPVVEEQERAWQEVVLEPEPDSVDHVLQALINRARFKQVGVEEVATELVERADLHGEQVSDVLAELVGRADEQAIDPDRSSELVLFNDAVPSRPGQLTDFARLNPADKKRIIIRVLCLLVARSEDQQLPPRVNAESGTSSWPLARAPWPSATGDDEVALPSRMAKSG